VFQKPGVMYLVVGVRAQKFRYNTKIQATKKKRTERNIRNNTWHWQISCKRQHEHSQHFQWVG